MKKDKKVKVTGTLQAIKLLKANHNDMRGTNMRGINMGRNKAE